MDAKRFDAITKAWTRLPRRHVLAGVAAGVFAPLLGPGARDVAAQPPTCQRSADCPGNAVCKNNTCVGTCGNPGKCSNYPFPFGCQSNGNCYCGKKPGGGGLCLLANAICPVGSCRRQSDCPEGTVCGAGCAAEGTCEPKFSCIPPCPLTLGITASEADATRSEGDQAQRPGRGPR